MSIHFKNTNSHHFAERVFPLVDIVPFNENIFSLEREEESSFPKENGIPKESLFNSFFGNIPDFLEESSFHQNNEQNEREANISNTNIDTPRVSDNTNNINPKNEEKKITGKKRGRVQKNDFDEISLDYSKHTKFDKDNILRKIQVNYITFLINYVNSQIKKYLPYCQYKFEDLVYNYKSNTSKKFMEELKSFSIGQILQTEATKKNKRNNIKNTENKNKITYNSIYGKCEQINNLLDRKYLDLFHEIYRNKFNDLDVEGISKFKDLLEKEKSKNFGKSKYCDLYIKRIDEIAEKEFTKPGSPLFNVKKH